MNARPEGSAARARAFDAAVALIEQATDAEIGQAAASGRLDSAAHQSSGSGFTVAAALLARPRALRVALAAGWLAERPCVFATAGSGRAAAWLPLDAVAYELLPCPMGMEEEAQCLRILSAGGVRMVEANAAGESALHFAARSARILPEGDEAPNPVLRALLDSGPNLEAADAFGRTPLAVARGFDNILDLLRAGANPLAADIQGTRAIDAALSAPGGSAALRHFERGLIAQACPEPRIAAKPRRL